MSLDCFEMLGQGPAQGSWQDALKVCQKLREVKEGAKQFALLCISPRGHCAVCRTGFTHFLICRLWAAG